ncbi:mechanosensitive ion channel family protein [Kineobactrum salinum]|uniref:Small-conductance mechanosensitive channel n=1 Tax=Kineobactrum salinum TaxID=2708301 RepID=A0A6C0U3R3_9GAMM|nr:mechanosensitive ion channel domain-containing protein [Kineobactrum salinum]QIB66666.1 mechanosensitive ion channel [Kineobactrum salinum]
MLDNLDLDPTLVLHSYLIPWGTRILLALAIFYVGRIAVSVICGLVEKLMHSRRMDEVLMRFLGTILRCLLLLFVIIASLSQLGIDTTSLVALLAAAGLAIGLSLQGSLSNLAAGVLLITFRPFTKGDFVEAGNAMGVVDSISIFTTTMTTPDNKEVIIPNSAILGNNITNFSARSTRRVDMVFRVSYGDDLRQARQLLEEIIAADDRVLADPPPQVVVGELADSSVNFLVRPWVQSADYWPVLWDTTEAVKLKFDEAGITIPFPQMEISMPRQDEEATAE